MADDGVGRADAWRREGEVADWFAPPTAPDPAPAPPASPADGLPGLTGPGRSATWTPTDAECAPGPGRAAPGREGWARTSGTYTPSVTDRGANVSIVLGVIGLVLCGIILGPAAIVEGVKARRRIAASGGGLTGNARATIGIVIGSVATFLTALGIFAVLLEAAVT